MPIDTRTVFARARAERDAHMAWVQRTAPLLAAEVGPILAPPSPRWTG